MATVSLSPGVSASIDTAMQRLKGLTAEEKNKYLTPEVRSAAGESLISSARQTQGNETEVAARSLAFISNQNNDPAARVRVAVQYFGDLAAKRATAPEAKKALEYMVNRTNPPVAMQIGTNTVHISGVSTNEESNGEYALGVAGIQQSILVSAWNDDKAAKAPKLASAISNNLEALKLPKLFQWQSDTINSATAAYFCEADRKADSSQGRPESDREAARRISADLMNTVTNNTFIQIRAQSTWAKTYAEDKGASATELTKALATADQAKTCTDPFLQMDAKLTASLIRIRTMTDLSVALADSVDVTKSDDKTFLTTAMGNIMIILAQSDDPKLKAKSAEIAKLFE